MGREKLSVVILTKNEEDKIRKCLESVKWADEVILVDGFSTDRTADIAKECGAKVIQHKFEGDFGEERNIGIDNSSGDWILQLDADEVVTEGFKNKVTDILNGNYRHTAYKFLRKNIFLGRFMRYGGWYHYSSHFFKKGHARYKGRVHHHLIADGEIAPLDVEIEHYPFASVADLITRQNRYTTIEAQEILELEGKLDEKKIRYNIKVKPVKLFWKFYVKKRGYREGMHGFVFSVLFAWVHFLKWVKYWELVREK
jgi:glycosyltransferase involved in cell wall biosynthesis